MMDTRNQRRIDHDLQHVVAYPRIALSVDYYYGSSTAIIRMWQAANCSNSASTRPYAGDAVISTSSLATLDPIRARRLSSSPPPASIFPALLRLNQVPPPSPHCLLRSGFVKHILAPGVSSQPVSRPSTIETRSLSPSSSNPG